MKIAVFTNPTKNNEEDRKAVEAIALELGFTLDSLNPDVVYACGGDGTILRAIHEYQDKLNSIKFFGANFGNMGFFYDFDKNQVRESLLALKEKNLVGTKHKLIEGKVYKDNQIIENFLSVNEVRIENNFKPMICDVLINDTPFETFMGTGLVVSSSIGSTAYNLTLSGSAVLNDFESLQLTLVQPSKQCDFFKSSLVMNGNSKVTFDLTKNGFEVLLGYDFIVKEHCLFDKIEISLSKKSFILLNKKGSTPLTKLTKLFD